MDEKSVATTNPLVVAEVEQNKRAQAALTPAEYKIFLKVSGRTKDYPDKDKFYASLSEDEMRIFNTGMTAARKDGGRRRTRRGNILYRLYNKMTHTRKHRGGMEKIVPDYIVRKTEAHLAKLKKENEEWRKKLAEEKAEKARKHAEAMANPRRSARLAAKKRSGGRRRGTRRGTRSK
jgi:hypothetical protein